MNDGSGNISSDPNTAMSQMGAEFASNWAEATAEESERLRAAMEKDTVKKAEANPSAMIPLGMMVVELPPPTVSAENEKSDSTSVKSTTSSSSVASAHMPQGKHNVGTKGTDDISQNEKVFGKVNDGQLMALMSTILSKWGESVEQAGDVKQKISTEKSLEAFNTFVDQVRQQGGAYPHYFDSHVIISTMIMATGLLGFVEGANKIKDDYKISFDALQQGTNITAQLIPGDMRAELGLLGAMMMASTVPYSAAWITFNKTEKGAEGDNFTKQFAQNYAAKMIQLTSDENYTSYLKAIVILHLEGSEQVSPNRISDFVNMLKIGLLMNSLALFYRIETGGGTPEEVVRELQKYIQGAIKGEQPIPDADPKAALLKTLALYYSALDVSDRESVIVAIMNYLPNSPKQLVDLMNSPLSTFTGLRDAGAFANSQIPRPA